MQELVHQRHQAISVHIIFFIQIEYIYIYLLPPKIYLFRLFVIFVFAESIGRLTEKEAAAMAGRKREQEFLQVLGSDNLAGEGMPEARV